MNRTGKVLSETPVSEVANEEPKQETRVLKVSRLATEQNHVHYSLYCGNKAVINPFLVFLQFGELQVELTPEKAYVGAVIAFFFG